MNERAGFYLNQMKDECGAEVYLSRALELFTEWGATGKASQLRSRHEFLRCTANFQNAVEAPT